VSVGAIRDMLETIGLPSSAIKEGEIRMHIAALRDILSRKDFRNALEFLFMVIRSSLIVESTTKILSDPDEAKALAMAAEKISLFLQELSSDSFLVKSRGISSE